VFIKKLLQLPVTAQLSAPVIGFMHPKSSCLVPRPNGKKLAGACEWGSGLCALW